MNPYSPAFYENISSQNVAAATRVFELVRHAVPPIASAVDLGCGSGAWLSVLAADGVDILGLDGPWVDRSILMIDPDRFREADFEQPTVLDQTYDLAISLEVAEHLAHEHAPTFVQSLTAASDFVLFSAAIPFQGGTNHINEQWPDYWAELFRAEGFSPLDFIRPQIWDSPDIPMWYRQNILLYVRDTQMHRIDSEAVAAGATGEAPLSVVHPELYQAKVEELHTLSGSVRQVVSVMKDRGKDRLGPERTDTVRGVAQQVRGRLSSYQARSERRRQR